MSGNKIPVSFENTFSLYARLWSYMKEYYLRFIISIIAMVAAAFTDPVFAHIMKPLIDKGFIAQDRSAIIYTPLLIILVFWVRAIAAYINAYMTAWLSGSVVAKLRYKVFSHLLNLPVQYYDDNNSGRMISRVVFDITQIADAGFNAITVVCRDGLTIIALFGLLFYTNWRLTMFCLVTLPFALILVRVLSHRLRKLSHHNQEQYGEMTQTLTESINGQKVVKLFGGMKYELTRFYHSIYKIKNNNVKQSATAALNSGMSQFLVALALALILYFAASNAKATHFTTGAFVSFITAIIMIFAPVKRITNVTQSLQKGLTAAQSVFEFLDIDLEINTGKKIFTKLNTSIAFNDVVFRYPSSTTNVLDHISITIPLGSKVALVGSSGSGKSTLVHLVPRFYNTLSGTITIDDIDIKEFELSSLRNKIAFVSQDVVLFSDTIYNNIAYGLQDSVTVDEVHEAASLANAMEFINDLPNGINTHIGENGVRLSGGQRQRMAIARAILRKAPILILDEATSALDNQSEKLVQEALSRLMGGATTTIVIAHRLSTVLDADTIVVMSYGKIVESGKHQELLDRNGAYARLYNAKENWVSDT